VHSFCAELMPDFQPTSDVTWWTIDSYTSSFNRDSDLHFLTHKTQCLPLELGISPTML
jgi:hypothetical protein